MRGDFPTLQNAIAQLQRSYSELYKRTYELNTTQQKEIEDIKRVLLTLMPQVKALESKLSQGDLIVAIINKWLNEHKQEIIDAIGEGTFVPWSYVKGADGTSATKVPIYSQSATDAQLEKKLDLTQITSDSTVTASTKVYATDKVDSMLGGKVSLSQITDDGTVTSSTKIYSQAKTDSKLGEKVNLTQIESDSAVTADTKVYDKGKVDSKLNEKLDKTDVIGTKNTSPSDTNVYNAAYINSLITATPTDKDSQTYTAAKIESLIEAGGVTDEHIVEVGNGHWIKLEGETAINNVLLTKKENGTLSLQLKGSDSTEGTIYVPNVQGWKDGDWQ